MYDTVRWIMLGLLFAGLFGLWLWSRRQALRQGVPGSGIGASFKVLQKRWVDQRTGVCLVEAEEKMFLLAYTVGGGVSWQALDKMPADSAKEPAQTNGRISCPKVIPDRVPVDDLTYR